MFSKIAEIKLIERKMNLNALSYSNVNSELEICKI